MLPSLRNGCYQHMMFLGVTGLVIVNHCDQEILLVDPWPTYCTRWTELVPTADRRELTNASTEAKARIANLASFLRNAAADGYTITAILLSHTHFDHADDAILLLELMAAEGENYTDHRGRQYLLAGPPVAVEDLPRIVCDYDTIVYLLTYFLYMPRGSIDLDGGSEAYWYGGEALRDALDEQERAGYSTRYANSPATWRRIRERYAQPPPRDRIVDDGNWIEINVGGRRLHYDDSFNERLPEESWCRAGEQCAELDLGHFHVVPYVWDHMNSGFGRRTNRALDDQSSGHLQRISAFMIERGGIQGAKRTFIVGSTGEMSISRTRALSDPLPRIETDVLVQAIVRRWVSIICYAQSVRSMWEFTCRNVTVNDALVFDHVEEFVREVASPQEYADNLKKAARFSLWTIRKTISREDMLRHGREVVEELAAAAQHVGSPGSALEFAAGLIRRGRNRRAQNNDGGDRRNCYARLLDENRVYALGRRGFEVDMPENPAEFEEEENAPCGRRS